MSEERTQVFRGDAAPEMAVAETGDARPARGRTAPSDQRSLQDQRDGETGKRESLDARHGEADVRALQDAQDGPTDVRALQDAQTGEAGLREIQDAQDGMSDTREMHDASDGPVEARAMRDAEGVSDTRGRHDADGPAEQRRVDDADGLSDTRQLHDHRATTPAPDAGGAAGARVEPTLNFNDDVPETPTSPSVPATPAAKAQEAPVRAPVPAPTAQSDADLDFRVERDATPWALSIHLEQRIASLGVTTQKVNQQLDALEESTKRLAKRIGK